jgi:hypothetical protein
MVYLATLAVELLRRVVGTTVRNTDGMAADCENPVQISLCQL